ncbi:hypothetical protein HQ36_02040 [Porphyromonas gingivicanis]|uniref:Phage-like protein n=1 Tax=Porphyromonas gingivicanis TaxID=266762 RepID=A0A0A2G7M4_9PORP|nr:DUF2815 family protein [Porphyromonas gingivicanis]KGN98417.1 hypothetical protein HQ36_02040 [Porphyromonas gingivicanis]
MITPIIKETKVVFGPCRLSYTHVFNRFSPDGDPANGKYMTNILIPREEKETIKAIQQAIDAAKKSSIAAKWGGKEPKKLDLPLRDGDDKENDPDGIYADHFYLNAKCSTRPGVCDKNKTPIVDEDEVYSGVWAVVSVTFFGYDVSGNKGVACGLNNIMKFKDDDRLGGRTSAENDFADVDLDDEDDDL